jgi:hypothetical protein
MEQILNAAIANALIWMIIVLAGTLLALARLFAPTLTRIANALMLLQQAVSDQHTSNELQTVAIERLRDDIHNRFDLLPSQIRTYLMDEMERERKRRAGGE